MDNNASTTNGGVLDSSREALVMKAKKMRNSKIQVGIVEDHHDVIPVVHSFIRNKYLPLTENVLVHLDSHPDMLIPQDLAAEMVYKKNELYENCNIENWILPLVFAGHFRTVVWIKPPWCEQFKDGTYKFDVGQDESHKIKVTCAETYFLSEGLYSVKELLENRVELEFIVCTMCKNLDNRDSGEGDFDEISKILDKVLDGNRRFVLDIDLDFFSTKNPFREFSEIYEDMKELYKFELPTDYTDEKVILEKADFQNQKLKILAEAWKHLESNSNLNGFLVKTLPNNFTLDKERMERVSSVCKRLPEYGVILNDMGMTFDVSELPHHVSTKEEMEYILKSGFEKLLDYFLSNVKIPSGVTISRSAVDEYTPPEDVEWIQSNVVNILQSKFVTGVDVHYKYLETDGDNM